MSMWLFVVRDHVSHASTYEHPIKYEFYYYIFNRVHPRPIRNNIFYVSFYKDFTDIVILHLN